MDKLFNEWKKSTPKYDKNLEHLFKSLTRKGGGAEVDREDKGKIFSNNYELYIFAFFLGLYNNKYEELPETAELKDLAMQYSIGEVLKVMLGRILQIFKNIYLWL